MFNILVPTDFSDLSKAAIHYALDMARKMKGKVSLLHVIETSQHASGNRLRLGSLIKELVHIAEDDFAELIDELKEAKKIQKSLKHKVVQGASFVKVVSDFAKKNKINLIIMGTHGASGLRKVFMGSNAAAMLEHSKVAVLAVPGKATFKSLKSVVYATDLLNTEKEFKKIIKLFGISKPIVHIIHVAPDRNAAATAETGIDKIVGKVKYKNSVVRVFVNENVSEVINEYVRKMNVDMLSMFHHEHSFFQKLIKPSVTKELSYYNNVPLLAFQG